MIIGIMQPYFFPYIGYFQLINAVDKFIIYDDVNYIKQGWINRNRILLDGKAFYLTLNLKGASSFKKINEIQINISSNKLLKTIYQAYNKAPYFSEVYTLIEKIALFNEINLANFVTNSVIEVSKYLGINTNFISSSNISVGKELKADKRIIEICKYYGASEYYNAIGGKNLYASEFFKKEGINLKFIKTNIMNYRQFNNEFIPFLSIIDVMFFNSKNEIKELLLKYELE
jgi:hypothetical protein